MCIRDRVYVNGEEAKFKGTLGKTRRTGSSVEYPVVVEDKEVFVLGDNREISEDSREFGTVKTLSLIHISFIILAYLLIDIG